MSDDDTDPELTELLADLTRTLRDLQDEVEPDGGPRLPTPSELSRFTSEVAIPGLILFLKTQIRALQLIRRALRMADGRNPSPNSGVSEVRDQAQRVGEASMNQLEGVLDELQSALEQRPPDDEARELLTRARDLQNEVSEQLNETQQNASDRSGDSDEAGDGDAGASHRQSDPVDIDVESELRTLKDNLDAVDDGDGDETDGDDADDGDGDDDDTDSDGTSADNPNQ